MLNVIDSSRMPWSRVKFVGQIFIPDAFVQDYICISQACWSACRLSTRHLPLAVAVRDRKQACDDVDLPQKYEEYLDTSFLGLEESISVGPVQYSYFRFGPLSSTVEPGTKLTDMHLQNSEKSKQIKNCP